MRYLVYARKSSESEERQAQSIDDQLHDLRTLAAQRGLVVVDELSEARSAKEPGTRPVFAELMARIQAGEADAILCWHVNRLFRNPVDFGAVSWLLQTGKLKEIHTPTQTHRTGDNVLLLSVENGMANQYILDLKKAVERGLRSKVDKGWFPHRAPIGYWNENSVIVPDPERFAVIREAFARVASGTQSVPQVHEWLCERGFTTRKTSRRGGVMLPRAGLYALLGNLFYTGYFVRAGETHKGVHEPMISLSEFFRVQAAIHTRNTRKRTHEFAFSGLITCGVCGCAVVGERHVKKLKNGTIARYTYYSCSNAKGGCRRTVIREEEIQRQVARVLETLRVPDAFVAYAKDVINTWKDGAFAKQAEEKAAQAESLRLAEAKLNRLLDLRLADILTDTEYEAQKIRLGNAVTELRMRQQRSHEETDSLWENIENAVLFLHIGFDLFAGGMAPVQHLIAKTLGAQYVLTNGNLAIQLSPVFGRVHELKVEAETGSDKTKQDHSEQSDLVWWNTLDSIRSEIISHGLFFHDPVKTVAQIRTARCHCSISPPH